MLGGIYHKKNRIDTYKRVPFINGNSSLITYGVSLKIIVLLYHCTKKAPRYSGLRIWKSLMPCKHTGDYFEVSRIITTIANKSKLPFMRLLSLIYGNGLETDLKRTWNGGEKSTKTVWVVNNISRKSTLLGKESTNSVKVVNISQ